MNTHSSPMRRGMAPLAILLCTAGAFLATAVDGRDFAGIYDITNEIESEESVMPYIPHISG